MNAAPRGFDFPLEPLRRKREWELDDARSALAHANRSLREIEERIDALEIRFAAARAEWGRRMAGELAFDAQVQRLAASYAMELTRLLALARKDVEAARRAQEEAVGAVVQARQALEGIERRREEALEDFRRESDRSASREGDDAWLHRPHRKEIA